MKLIATYAISMYEASKYIGENEQALIEQARYLYRYDTNIEFSRLNEVTYVVGPSNVPYHKNVEVWAK